MSFDHRHSVISLLTLWGSNNSTSLPTPLACPHNKKDPLATPVVHPSRGSLPNGRPPSPRAPPGAHLQDPDRPLLTAEGIPPLSLPHWRAAAMLGGGVTAAAFFLAFNLWPFPTSGFSSSLIDMGHMGTKGPAQRPTYEPPLCFFCPPSAATSS